MTVKYISLILTDPQILKMPASIKTMSNGAPLSHGQIFHTLTLSGVNVLTFFVSNSESKRDPSFYRFPEDGIFIAALSPAFNQLSNKNKYIKLVFGCLKDLATENCGVFL